MNNFTIGLKMAINPNIRLLSWPYVFVITSAVILLPEILDISKLCFLSKSCCQLTIVLKPLSKLSTNSCYQTVLRYLSFSTFLSLLITVLGFAMNSFFSILSILSPTDISILSLFIDMIAF